MLSFVSRSVSNRPLNPKRCTSVAKKTSLRTRPRSIQGQKPTFLKATLSIGSISIGTHDRNVSQVSRYYCTSASAAPVKTASKAKHQPPQPTFGHLDVRVGRIVHVARHPHADTLYVEKIDVGEPAPRTIISGLVKYMKESELESKLVLVLCNLPSKEVRSIASHGMVLAASQTNSATGESKIALIEPPQNSTPGEAVFVDGEVSEILQGISGNRLEKILKKCKVDDKGVATFTTGDGSLKPIQTSTGSCTSTLSNASIS